MSQQLSLLSRIQLTWPEPLASAVTIVKVVQFDPEVVRTLAQGLPRATKLEWQLTEGLTSQTLPRAVE